MNQHRSMTSIATDANAPLSNNRYGLLIQKACSSIGFWLTLFVAMIVVINQYESLKVLDPFYRVTLPALCLTFSFITSAINVRWGLIGCLFTLPLLPNLTWQIQQYFGYGRILSLHHAGFDLMAGLFLGTLFKQSFQKVRHVSLRIFPWQAGLVMIVITASVVLAISRNLHQTASVFQLSSFFYNLTHLRSIGWHDDYRPLFDWVAYGCAFALISVITATLQSNLNRDDVIFKPLIISLIIAALVGIRQSVYGTGLSLIQLNFRVDQFGYMALGFQHDIHAFAGQMLIGAIGLFGYLYYTKSISTRVLILLCIPLCWVALFLSKSKSNFALAVICFAVITAVWIFKNARLLKPILKGLLVLITLLALSAIFFQSLWLSAMTSFAHAMGLSDLEALNVKLSYRPEVYLAAIKLFTINPILGLGQSEFYRQAANYSLTNSHFLSIDQNGENAHNYFLQTLAETGLVGILVFSLLIFYPSWNIRHKRSLIPAGIGLGAIFIGNIFAHSMLVRENLFIAAAFIGLMYAWLSADQPLTNVQLEQKSSAKTPLVTSQPSSKLFFVTLIKQPRIIVVLALFLSFFALREVYLSYRIAPFTEDIQCFKAAPLDPDGWTSGSYKIAIPAGAHGMILNIKGIQPDVLKRPLKATLSIMHGERSLIRQTNVLFTQNGPQHVSLNFPDDGVADDGEYRLELRLERCFIPRNLGINSDGRRLGIQIQSSTANYH